MVGLYMVGLWQGGDISIPKYNKYIFLTKIQNAAGCPELWPGPGKISKYLIKSVHILKGPGPDAGHFCVISALAQVPRTIARHFLLVQKGPQSQSTRVL